MRHLRCLPCRSVWSGAVVIVFGLASASATAQNANNAIKSIRNTGSEVELELTSSQEFPARDALIQLHIGASTFTRSRVPEGGELNNIVFSVPANQVGSLKDGDDIWVDFKGQERGGLRWDFGKLDKKRLNRTR